MRGDGTHTLKSAVYGTKDNLFEPKIPIPKTPQLLERIKIGPSESVERCREQMTNIPFPEQGGSGANHFYEDKWAELDPSIIRVAGKAPTNLSCGFLNGFLNSVNKLKHQGDDEPNEDEDTSKVGNCQGSQSQDEDRKGRIIVRNKTK
eukprot:831990-Heterocapsa_arctica.AAC.1